MDIKNFEETLKKDFLRDICIPLNSTIDNLLFRSYLIRRIFQIEVESFYELTENEIYEKLDHIIKWYHKFGHSASPDELLNAKDKIVTFSYWVSGSLSKIERKYEMKKQYVANEIERLYLQSSKDNNSHIARATAKNKKSSDLSEEAQYKSETKRLERLLGSLDKIIYAMQQRIAWLRQEANKTPEF